MDLGDPAAGEAGDTRPAVVVSRDSFNATAALTVTVVPGTSVNRGLSHHVVVSPRETGLKHITVFQPDQVVTLNRHWLVKPVGKLSVTRMRELSARLASYLDL